MQFKIEQVALSVNPGKRALALALLEDLGMTDWAIDNVTAVGSVDDDEGLTTKGLLAFNYQAGDIGGKAVELELLHYTDGDNFVDRAKAEYVTSAIATHIGMHCTEQELEEARAIFAKYGITTSQEVRTIAHTNPAIKDSRRYQYSIFATRSLIGIDLKFIVRLPFEAPALKDEDSGNID